MKKLTNNERKERRIILALSSIKKLGKFYSEDTLNRACQRFTQFYRKRTKAEKRKLELEEELKSIRKKFK